MTEKRFKLSKPNGAYLIDDDKPYAHWINDDDKIVDLLNSLADENEQLHSELAEKDIQIDYLKNENKHFQQRNNRQAEQLDNLYNLIEKEDWQTLKGIIQEFQEWEEQLQKEWKCYCE